jgi:hypothetical protein
MRITGTFQEYYIFEMFLPAFAESRDREGGDEWEKRIHRSLLTAIAWAAAGGTRPLHPP